MSFTPMIPTVWRMFRSARRDTRICGGNMFRVRWFNSVGRPSAAAFAPPLRDADELGPTTSRLRFRSHFIVLTMLFEVEQETGVNEARLSWASSFVS